MIRNFVFVFLSLLAISVFADGPADNNPATVRRIPKLGIEVPAAQRAELEGRLAELKAAIQLLLKKNDPRVVDLLPDVEVYYKAVHDALVYQEFFDAKDLTYADMALATGLERADRLGNGESPWTTATGLVVRGYVSKIDGSVQPYGLVVPESYTSKTAGRYRCDLWFHGRGETLSELNFIRDRSNNRGTFTPEDTIVLHPYGRYSNAFKFAGETDVLEALESVKQRYRVDEDRISVRGFSMGGAAAWHFAAHYPDRWFAANPGAGFSETPEFLRVFQQEELKPTWWEQKLWQWYDCPGYAANFRYCPTVAYSGELDSQKQAADVMERALGAVIPKKRSAQGEPRQMERQPATLEPENLQLLHVIGPGTKHAYEVNARREVEARMMSLAKVGRHANASGARFTTYTLRYNRLQPIVIEGLEQHWKEATVGVDISGPKIRIQTSNVSDLTIELPAGQAPESLKTVELVASSPDGRGFQRKIFDAFSNRSDRSLQVSLHDGENGWALGKRPDDRSLRKRHGLQGPIDDAFMDSFIFVRPTGKARHEMVGKWAEAELSRAVEHWRRHFRGEPRVKDDVAITTADMADANLILWGDPASNDVLKRIAGQLPIQWNEDRILAGARTFPADSHSLVAIHPNPLNANRYVVLNSSFTFRDYAYLNNARQVPMLPDWAVVDLTTPPNAVWPGKIVAADFFDERWRLKVSPESAAPQSLSRPAP